MTPNPNLQLISTQIDVQKLPPFFQHGLLVTDNPVSADMLMIAMLTATSSVLPRFCFRHGFPEHTYHANLMSLVIAPPASGKGIMNLTNRLVEWNGHMIAGNSSISAFLSELEALKGRAYMMETEADVMSKTLRVDNNDYSYILRQAWEGETIRRARDGRNKQRIVIPQPQFSLLLSGTMNQLQPLLRSRENGLTSRLLCYLVSEIQGFDSRVFGQDILSDNCPAEQVYDNLADYLRGLYEWQLSANHDCIFRLTDKQTAELTGWFSDMYQIMMMQANMPIGFDSVMKRLAVTIMRIGLILSAVRLPVADDFPKEIMCCDDDFRTMLVFAEALMVNMVEVFHVLPEEEQFTETSIVLVDRHAEALARQQAFLDCLPDQFTRSDMHQMAEQQQLSARTTDRWLTNWLNDNLVDRCQHGTYQKRTK